VRGEGVIVKRRNGRKAISSVRPRHSIFLNSSPSEKNLKQMMGSKREGERMSFDEEKGKEWLDKGGPCPNKTRRENN